MTKNNKIAVVTGAGGTLCSAMAIDLAKQGWRVALLGRTLSKLKNTQETILEHGGVAICVSADVSSEEEVAAAKDEIEKQLGVASLLINGAGGNQSDALPDIMEFDERELQPENDTVKGFFNLDMDTFRSVNEINTMGTVIPCFVFGRSMATQRHGNIINFASMTSYRPITRVAAPDGIVSLPRCSFFLDRRSSRSPNPPPGRLPLGPPRRRQAARPAHPRYAPYRTLE